VSHIKINDVAKAAGVSPASVSRYFNSPELLREVTRRKIEEAINEVDYRPNMLASNLRGHKTNTIGLIMPSLMNLYYIDLYSTIRNAILPKGYMVNLYTTEFDPNMLKEHLRHVSQCRYDGVIVCFLDGPDTNEVLADAQKILPMVLITSDPENNRFDNVYVDAFDGIFQVTTHIIETGKKKLAFASGAMNSVFTKEKFNAYRTALEKAGLDFNPDHVFYGEHNHHYTGYMAMRKFLSIADTPDAVVCATDDIAIGCMKFLLERGIKIPDDMAVSGFNGISMLSTYSPSITTVAQAIQAEADSAVSMLLDRIAHPGHRKRRVVYKVTLVKGKSTTPDAPEGYMTVIV